MNKLTPKQEKFCQKYIELGNASEAYRGVYNAAAMLPSTTNRKAKELLDNGKIRARLDELRQDLQAQHEITVNDLLNELETARTKALAADNPQCSAAIAATMAKAKLLGLDKGEPVEQEAQPVQMVINVRGVGAPERLVGGC